MDIRGSTLEGTRRVAESMLDTLLRSSTEHAIIATDLNGQVLVWNEGASRLFGWTAENALGASILEFWDHEAIPEPLLREIAAIVRAGRPWEGSVTGRRQGGAEVSTRVTITPMRDGDELSGYLIIARDKAVELDDLSANIRTMLGAIVEDRDADRRRVAVEIHDDTIQVMTAVALKLQSAQRTSTNPLVADVCAVVGGEVESAIARLRDLMLELHPPRDTPNLLRNTLEVLLEESAAAGNFHGSIRGRPQREPSEKQVETIYRIVREAMNNVVRHSDATRVKVVVTDHDGGILTQVRDNGLGFDVAKCQDLPGHLGMSGMREHAQSAGGRLTVRSEIGRGATVELWLPLAGAS